MSYCPISLEDVIEPQWRRFQNTQPLHRPDPSFIPVHLTGGIGDIIMSIDAIKQLAEDFQIVVYAHHDGAFKYFINDIPIFPRIPDFTWKLEFNTIAKFHLKDSFSGFLIDSHRELFLKQKRLFEENPRLERLVKFDYDRFFLISRFAKEMNWDRREFPMRCLGYENFARTRLISETSKNYITVHDGFDVHNRSLVSGRATKTWNLNHWNRLIQDFKKLYPGMKVVQLGSPETSRQIDTVDECLIGKTTIEEAFDILKYSNLHIDGDSGLVHAATRLEVPCIVLWGPTPDYFYGYAWNINLRATDACSGSCYGVKENWNDRCVVGHPSPICMDSIRVETVLDHVSGLLSDKL